MKTTPEPTNITRDGVTVRPGQIWEDCDKRMDGRQVVVRKVVDGKAHVEPIDAGRPTTIAVRRMHPHSTGFRLVKEAPRG